ncbi:unnamed protein product [Xylocopa violacea]|uniref:Uncharacterized protein n=1 Tax=Xylocopa violacea TaxID=135666 RepID=A0ABP1NFU8_XYLVO
MYRYERSSFSENLKMTTFNRIESKEETIPQRVEIDKGLANIFPSYRTCYSLLRFVVRRLAKGVQSIEGMRT